jgi:two-component system, NtrC family, response regulator AtoC
MDVDLQAKLLRVLQSGQFERVGGDRTIQTDVRIISATNRDLEGKIVEGSFREDLLYRLNVVIIHLPPLRERRQDIPLIAEHIVRRLSRKYDWPQLALSRNALAQLAVHSWPGNIRELQNALARAAILCRGRVIEAGDLESGPASTESQPVRGLLLRDILAETERRVIAQALEHEGWNRTRAAQLLGISRRQLFDKIQQYGLQK